MMGKMSIADLVRDGAILAIQDGNHGEKHPTAADYVERDGVPFVMARDFPNGNLDLRNVTLLHQDVADKLRVGFAKPGDVLLTHKGTVGATGIVPDGFKYVMLTPQVTYYRTDPRRLLNTYLRCAFRAPDFQHQLTSLSAQSTRPFVSISAQRALTVPVPPVPVQRRIAGILSAYDNLIENCERRIHVLDEMARSLYREWFVLFRYPGHEKTPLVESPLGRIPKGWAVRPVKDLATVIYGFPFKSPLFSTDSSGRTPIIRIRDIPVGASSTYTSEAAEPRYEIENGDILVGMDGDFHMTIWSNGRALQNQRVARFRPAVGWTSLQLLIALERPIQALNTAIVGTTVAHLGDMHIREIQIVEPSAEMLARSRTLFEPIELEIRTLQQRVRNLRKTRDLLLPRLLSGQLSMEDAA